MYMYNSTGRTGKLKLPLPMRRTSSDISATMGMVPSAHVQQNGASVGAFACFYGDGDSGLLSKVRLPADCLCPPSVAHRPDRLRTNTQALHGTGVRA
jgi:hypothetical protein